MNPKGLFLSVIGSTVVAAATFGITLWCTHKDLSEGVEGGQQLGTAFHIVTGEYHSGSLDIKREGENNLNEHFNASKKVNGSQEMNSEPRKITEFTPPGSSQTAQGVEMPFNASLQPILNSQSNSTRLSQVATPTQIQANFSPNQSVSSQQPGLHFQSQTYAPQLSGSLQKGGQSFTSESLASTANGAAQPPIESLNGVSPQIAQYADQASQSLASTPPQSNSPPSGGRVAEASLPMADPSVYQNEASSGRQLTQRELDYLRVMVGAESLLQLTR